MHIPTEFLRHCSEFSTPAIVLAFVGHVVVFVMLWSAYRHNLRTIAQTLEDLAEVMGDASICGLGQAAPNPIRSIQKYFADEVSRTAWLGSLPPPGEPLVAEHSIHGETK